MIDAAVSRAVPWYYYDTHLYRFDIEELDLAYDVSFDIQKGVAEIFVTVEIDGEPSIEHIAVGYDIMSKIFHTLWAIIQDFIRRSNIAAIQFGASAKEPSRVRLYATLAKQMATYFGSEVSITKSRYRKDITYIVPVASRK